MSLNKNLFNNLIKKALENGIEAISCTGSQTRETLIEYVNGNLDKSQNDLSGKFSFSGLIDNKIASYTTDYFDDSMIEDIISTLKDLSKFGKPYKKEYFTKEQTKFKNLKAYNKDVIETPVEELKKVGKTLSDSLKNKNKKVIQSTECSTMLAEEEVLYVNSLNTVYLNKSSISEVFLSATFVEENNIKSASDYEMSIDGIDSLNLTRLVQKVYEEGMSALKAKKIRSGFYTAVLSFQPVSVLLSTLVEHMDSEKITENTSVLKNNFDGKPVISSKITVKTDSSTRSLITNVHDVDHRPIKDKVPLIKKGILQTPLYNNEYAEKNNTTSNALVGATIRVVPGKESLEEAISKIKKGIYVKNITSLHSSLNPLTLSFSCPFEGYLIKDGKIESRVDLGMISGNCRDVLKNVKKVLNETSDKYGNFTCEMVANKITFTCK